METKLEIIRLISEIIGVVAIIYLVIKNWLQDKKHTTTFKRNDELVNIVRFLDEVSRDNQNGLDFTLLNKIPIKDVEKYKDKIICFYQKKFYSEPENAKKLGKFLFFVNDCACDDDLKKIIRDCLKEATKKVPLEDLAFITAQLIVDKVKGVGLVKFSTDFLLENLYELGYAKALVFLEHFGEEISNILDKEALTHQEKGMIAVNVLAVKNHFK